jgi:copper chaperone CopZ
LTQLPEVDAVESDLEEKMVVVHCRDGIMGTSDIREAVERDGFPVA